MIVALDVQNEERALELIDILSPIVDIFKVGIAPFTGYGHSLLEKLNSIEKKVFLDLKFHDIPNTVANAARAAARRGIFMLNFHCMGGKDMLQSAVEGAKASSEAAGVLRPILLGVTVLTSMSEEDLEEIGLEPDVNKKVLEFAKLAYDSGLDGVVASAKEAKVIKKEIGKDFIVVTPGVRPKWASKGDQKRVLSPGQAISEGADYIVVGRPIIQAEDPREAAEKIIEEIG